MELDMEVRRDTLLVRPSGELDLGVSDTFREALEQALDRHAIRHMVLNLAGISFIDSSGLGVILGRYKRLAGSGGRISLVGARPQVRRILELSGLLRIMSEYPSEEEAITKAG